MTTSPAAGNAPRKGRKARRARGLGMVFWLSAAWVTLVVALAAAAGLLPLADPAAVGAGDPGLGPSAAHLLGTDELGRDLFSRVVHGARISLVAGFVSITLGLIVGGTLGLIAGFRRGAADTVVTTLANSLLAFPALVLALAVVTFLGQSPQNVTLTIGLVSVAPIAMVVRGATIGCAGREYVVAARMLGAKNRRIILREIIPNVAPVALSLSLVWVATAIVAEGSLAYLGLSVQPPTPSWGAMIAEGRNTLAESPGTALWPSLFMFLTVLGLNFAGDRLRDRLDVKGDVS
ncbi:ABC transporter permease [Spongiactinospora gelatinilytica]|nr:ABC transporter permease [Spongiactinospora gelatinilytica]